MSAPTADAQGVRLLSASAGSGKTYRLTKEVLSHLAPQAGPAPPIDGLIAVTYTTKAQAELESRLRRALVQRREFDRAESLPLAYLGTVHAVCLQLIKEFALDAGLSPAVDGLPQEAARQLLQEALERELSPELRRRLDDTSSRLEVKWDHRTKRFDWITPVEEILTLARNNRIAPERLADMAKRSAQALIDLLGPPRSDGEQLERELAQEVATAIEALAESGDTQRNTQQVLEELKNTQHALRRGPLRWSEWCKLSKLAPGKRSLPLVSTVQQTAEQYLVHPRLHDQLREQCELLFEAARVGLSAYSRWKTERGLVDYVDMIDHALSILAVPDVERELAQCLDLLVVDEFQDTSPIQLALFTRLHGLCKRSLWVGDRKQCIFEYAGADPALMDAAAQWVREYGGETNVLGTNYRSRPELVNAVSVLFSHAFAAQGHRVEEVETVPHRTASDALSSLPEFGVWWLTAKRNHELEAVAEGVRRLLSAPDATPVLDRETSQVRALRPGDVAVLLSTNKEAERLAIALKQRGIASALAQTGLMSTPEATLLCAALRILLDGSESLAVAELEALLGFEEGGHEAWLSRRIRLHQKGESQVPNETQPQVQQLHALRSELAPRSPVEIVEQVLATLDLSRIARRWPDPEQRLANLDALRGLSVAYENRCAYLREAASLAGLLRYFEETQIETKQRDEERASDEQHVAMSKRSVVLSTYHKAKGLEWPVVVLGSLHQNKQRDVFGVAPESDRERFDAADPLGARWIRYWPWPLGAQRASVLRQRAEASAVGRGVAERDARERVRLLYVGFTRARDHLIVAVPSNAKGKPRLDWLNQLRDEQGPLLTLPAAEDAPQVTVRGDRQRTAAFAARVWSVASDETTSIVQAPPTSARWFTGAPRVNVRSRFAIRPSSALDDGLTVPDAQVVSQVRLTSRMPFTQPANATWDQVGTVLHAFLAADCGQLDAAQRLAIAARLLHDAGLAKSFEPHSLLNASDAWQAYVETKAPAARWHREMPITATLDTPSGLRRIEGTIDLWLETSNGGFVVDHKSFPGRAEHWSEQAVKHAPQLFAYGRALETAGHRVHGYLVHFTIGGGVVELQPVTP